MLDFRKPEERKQGLKILFYGENNSGKSMAALTFPKNAIFDSESKIGVYENDPLYKGNIAGIADTANHYDLVRLTEKVLKSPESFNTLTYDSYTNIYESMQVAMMELEEKKAKDKKKEVDDAVVAQRGWGKIKLNTLRVNNLIAQASALGITVVAVAHKDDVMQDLGNGKSVKIGEKPVLRKNAEHTFDIVLRFFKEKDIVTGEYKYLAEVEKDTTKTYKIGTKLENVTYDTFKEYIERSNNSKTIETNYGETISDTIKRSEEEDKGFQDVLNEFKSLYKELSQDDENKTKIAKILKENKVEKYNDPSSEKQLLVAIGEIKKLQK